MHVIQRIFYFHVPAGMIALIDFIIVFIANIAYLITAAALGLARCLRRRSGHRLLHHRADHRADLGEPVWGIWWTWDARLTSTFVLWLLYISFLCCAVLWKIPSGARSFRHFRHFRCFWTSRSSISQFASGARSIPNRSLSAARTPASIPHAEGLLLLDCFALVMLVILQRYALERARHECDELR